jgi:hypothetical protein
MDRSPQTDRLLVAGIIVSPLLGWRTLAAAAAFYFAKLMLDLSLADLTQYGTPDYNDSRVEVTVCMPE